VHHPLHRLRTTILHERKVCTEEQVAKLMLHDEVTLGVMQGSTDKALAVGRPAGSLDQLQGDFDNVREDFNKGLRALRDVVLVTRHRTQGQGRPAALRKRVDHP
jgi:hypothetical protein